MPWVTEIEAVIFDMDGVLIDSEPAHILTDAATLDHFGVRVSTDEVAGYAGVDVAIYFAEMRTRYGISAPVTDLVAFKNKRLVEALRQGAEPVPGLQRLIAAVSDRPLRRALASSSDRAVVNVVLERLGLADWFETTVAGNEVTRTKPFPDVFLEVARRLGVPPERCLVIEDTATGIQAARTAGMRTSALRNPLSGTQDLSPADAVFESLTELARVLAREDLRFGVSHD